MARTRRRRRRKKKVSMRRGQFRRTRRIGRTINVFKCGVREPWGSHIRDRTKMAEGRMNAGKWVGVKPRDILEIKLDDGDIIRRTVKRVVCYNNIRSALENDLNKLLPGVKSVEDGLRIYKVFYDITRPFISIHMQ